LLACGENERRERASSGTEPADGQLSGKVGHLESCVSSLNRPERPPGARRCCGKPERHAGSAASFWHVVAEPAGSFSVGVPQGQENFQYAQKADLCGCWEWQQQAKSWKPARGDELSRSAA